MTSTRRCRSFCITCREAPMPHTTPRRNGSKRSAICIFLIRAGTHCAMRFSPTRKKLGVIPQDVAFAGGTAVAWPLRGRAQQAALPVVGVVSGQSPHSDARNATAFYKGLSEAGYIDGQNVTV